MSSNVIRVAMCTIIHPWISKGKLSEFINHIAALLDSAAQASSAAKIHGARCKWFVVRAFLWPSWQRTVMIYFSFLLALNLDSGVDDGQASRAVFLQSLAPTSGMSLQEMSKRYETLGKSHYMCAWAFDFLRKNPVFLTGKPLAKATSHILVGDLWEWLLGISQRMIVDVLVVTDSCGMKHLIGRPLAPRQFLWRTPWGTSSDTEHPRKKS